MAISAVWYLAFVDDDTVEFDPEIHNVQDIELLGFNFFQRETEFATLMLLTKNKISGLNNWALGLLRPAQKKCALFSWSLNGAEPSLLARLRLVGLPNGAFKSTVTLEFSARPSDFNAQKEALNDAMRVLPYWDRAFIDEQKQGNLDIILDTYAGYWYTDPVTHEVSFSDFLLGAAGTEVFQRNEHAADGFDFTLGDPPLTSVTVDAEVLWTQRAVGWAGIGFMSESYTLKADSYPKVGAALGDGWKVLAANVTQPFTFETKSIQKSAGYNIKWWDGEQSQMTASDSDDIVQGPGILLSSIVTDSDSSSTYAERDESGDPPELTGWSVSRSWTTGLVPRYAVTAEYIAGYDAKRPYTEHVTFTLTADVQPIVTLPGDDETLRLDGINTADLSELIDGVPPIGDPRRRSYMTQARGQQSLQYLILLARAQLRKRARAVEISFAPFLTRLEDLKLNRNAQVYDWRIPGGNAIGKIIAFTLTLTPPVDDGAASVSLECTIGCAVGNGGTVSAEGGEEEYVDDGYIDANQDYQQYDGAILTFNDEVGFTPPPFAPNDDGLEFTAGFNPVNDPAIFEVPIAYTKLADEQQTAVLAGLTSWLSTAGHFDGPPPPGFDTWVEARADLVAARGTVISIILSENETDVSFKLKGMSKEFKTEVPIIVTPLKVPQMINLGAT